MVGESPRWHQGRLWFSNWGAQEIIAADVVGNSEVVTRVPTTIPFSIDWLPDGRLLVVSGPEGQLLRRESDGSLVTHADLRGLSDGWNQIVVDGRGNIYVNSPCSAWAKRSSVPGSSPWSPGRLGSPGCRRHRVPQRHGHHARQPDADRRRVLRRPAHGVRHCRRRQPVEPAGCGPSRARPGADGICLDADGDVWTPTRGTRRAGLLRVREGGEVLQRIELDRVCFACMLGGEDGKTLFMMVAEFQGVEKLYELFRSRTSQVLTAPASVGPRRRHRQDRCTEVIPFGRRPGAAGRPGRRILQMQDATPLSYLLQLSANSARHLRPEARVGVVGFEPTTSAV